ncbi:MAG: hypothetical protein J6A91_00385 [Bacteroidales bacterium]|nr:hypothetical protein [Bacteroidales bacterium]
MKLSKFMCAAFAAAMVLAGCNKENETPVDDGSNGFKSVTLKLENVAAALTKLPSEDYIGNSDNVYLSSFQVFFSDGTNLFEAYNVDQSAPAETFFKLPDDLTTTKQFHYLPHAVNEVLVIGNFQDKINLGTVGEGKKYSLSRQELRTQINQLKIEEQQDPKNLKLFGTDQVLSETTIHAEHGNVVYAANVTLKPAVARFEITGFKCDAEDASGIRLYENVKIQQLTARTYFEKATVAVSGESALTVTGEQLDAFNEHSYTVTDGNAPSYFNAVAGKGWFSDDLDITLQDGAWEVGNTNPTTAAPYTTVDPANVLYSYHVFPGKAPQFLAKILASSAGVDVPLYLKTNSIRTQDGILDGEKVVAGNIYRLSFNFVDTSFDQPEKCVDLTVSVAQWSVNVLTPIF